MRQERSNIKIRKEIFAKKSGEELPILGHEEKNVFILNETGRKIWELLNKGKDIEDIVVYLEKEYRIDKISLRKEVKRFLEDIREHKDLVLE